MNYEKLIAQLKIHEGCKLKPYYCTAGKLTTGVGRCLDTNPLTAEEREVIGHDGRKLPITAKQADYLLLNDIRKVISHLNSALPWFSRLDDVRQRVLVDMAFNLGVAGLLGFKLTLSLIQNGNYEKASTAMLQSRWAQQVKGRAITLSAMMKTGRDV